MADVRNRIDQLVCHNVDHIEVFAEVGPEGTYEVDIHCTCGKEHFIGQKDWEELVHTFLAEDET